ncbi:MAG: oligosaccharide flippase family protein [Bacteroidales bacterium]|nr:oligosaccharide flippase family protein [Bacteroidales bacterium]
MQRKFLTNLAFLIFLNLVVKPFWVLGIDRSVQNIVGIEDFGFYFSILNFSFLFSILLDMGLTSYNNRNIAQYNHMLGKYLSSILTIKILLAVLYFITIVLVGLIIGYGKSQFQILAWIGLNQFLLSLTLYLRSNISGLMMFRTDSMLSVLDRILMIAICSVLLWGGFTHTPFRIEWFVYAQTASYFLTASTAFIIVIRKASFKRLNWNLAIIRTILRQSYPFALLVLLMAFYNRIDPVMIERLLPGHIGEAQSGIYAQAFRLLDAANMIAYLFAVLLLPIFSRMIYRKESLSGIIRLSFSLLITLSGIVAIGSFFYSRELMEFLYPMHPNETVQMFASRMGQSSIVFGLLMFCFISVSTTYVFGTLLTANGSLKILNMTAALGMLLGVTLNIILVPRLMATGSAWASLISQTVTALVQVLFAVRILQLRTDRSFLLRLIGFLTGTLLMAWLSGFLAWPWHLNLSLMAAASFLLAFLLRMVDLKGLRMILQKGSEMTPTTGRN